MLLFGNALWCRTRGNYAKAVFQRGALPGLTIEDIEVFLKQLANIRLKKLNINAPKLFPEVGDILELTWASSLFAGLWTTSLKQPVQTTKLVPWLVSGNIQKLDSKKDSDIEKELALI